ncbi:hypothetical protein HN51_065848, partial [Arachis hypogaea]
MSLTTAMWDPAADLIKTRANDSDESKGTMVTTDIFLNDYNQKNLMAMMTQRTTDQFKVKGVNDNAELGGFDESESEKTVTQICTGRRSGSNQIRNISHGGVQVNGFLKERGSHKISNNTKQLLGHSRNGLEKEYWCDGPLSGVHRVHAGGAQEELSGMELQQGGEKEIELGPMRASGSGPVDQDETSHVLDCGDKDEPGRLRACGSGSRKGGRADQQQCRGSGQDQMPLCTPGSKMHDGDSTRVILSEADCATLPVVEGVDNQERALISALRGSVADCPGGVPSWPGGEAENRSLALVKCAGEGEVRTVGRKPPATVDDEPEVESLAKEGSGQSAQLEEVVGKGEE